MRAGARLPALPIREASGLDADVVLARLDSGADGLSSAEAASRLTEVGPNALRSHEVRARTVLGRQLHSTLLVMLLVTAALAFIFDERDDELLIVVILAMSVGLGFVQDYRTALASRALHTRIRFRTTVRRDGAASPVDVTELVPGDVVELSCGAMVPADLRVLEADHLECDESVLTGVSTPVPKHAGTVSGEAPLTERASCLFMGTIVQSGSAVAVVVTTGGRSEFGRIATGLGDREPDTQFQAGLRDFSVLLGKVAGWLTAAILMVNLVVHRPVLEALLFALAMAVGITPRLLPAIVSTNLTMGARRLEDRRVRVKRLVSIEDLGDVDVLLTDFDGPKASGPDAIARVRALGIAVKIVTSESPEVAMVHCREVDVLVDSYLDGREIDTLSDVELSARCEHAMLFAAVTPTHAARIVAAHRRAGRDVAFLGTRAEDAVAVHRSDVGISVDGAAEVARDAADVLLLEHDLDVFADGVVESRRTFSNTIKYVLLGASSNLGNMLSAGAASAFLRFLPLLPSQILLNNLLCDTGQFAIGTDHVDEENLARPAHWDTAFVRQFIGYFAPLSSLFDFATFAVLIGVFHTHATRFRSGWFVESLATQALVVLVLRTRRRAWSSRPSTALVAATLAVVAVGVWLPVAPFHATLGFRPMSVQLYSAVALIVVVYLAVVETMKRRFFSRHVADNTVRRRGRTHHVHRIASRWSHSDAPISA